MNRKGFTFIELLVSITIVSLVGLAVYSVFANGMRAWQRGNVDRTYARNLRLSSEKMVRDLRNTFRFSNIAFEGKEDFVIFPALVPTEYYYDEGEQVSCYGVGRIAYFYDKKRNSLCKEEKTYQEIFEEEDIGEGKVLVTDISRLEFSYCYLDNATGTYKWKDAWRKEEQDTIPQAVKIEMSFEKAPLEEGEFSRIIFIPIGTGEQKITFE